MHHPLEEITKIHAGSPQENPLIRRILHLIHNWPWVLLSIVVCVVVGLLYLRYSTPKYEISASILVKDDTKGTDMGEAAILENLGLSAGKSNVDNEVEILKSRALMEKVVADLQLNVSYFAKGKIKTTELFETSPVKLHFLTPPLFNNKTNPITYLLDISNSKQFRLTNDNRTWQQQYGDTLVLPEGSAILTKTTNPKPLNSDSYLISILPADETAKKYSEALHVSATNKQVSIIALKLTDILAFKGEVILSKLIDNYLKTSILDKNRIADSTIAFIDKNLEQVTQELIGIEKRIEDYRTTNQIADLREQSRMLLTNKSTTDKEQRNTEVNLNIIESLLAFVKDNPTGIVPSYVAIQNPGFVATIDKYNEIQLSRDRVLNTHTPEHPTVQNFELQLKNIRNELTNHIQARKEELLLNREVLIQDISGTQRQINAIPANERTFLDHTRQQQIKQELYVFLLKKRMETSISKSSTLANGRIIDPAKAEDIPVSPDRQLTILVSLLIGLFLPIAFFNIQEIFSTRVTNRQELSDLIDIPIIGEIGTHKYAAGDLFETGKSGYVGEQFRTLRTNLRFVPSAEKNKVILVTSSTASEGKTFIAINLCRTLLLSGKRVILVECDLRKPTIGANLDIRGKGLSEYIISNLPVEEIIKPSAQRNSFDVIIAGIIPPNPAELLQFARTHELIIYLREHYDYVIIDSAPFNLVTDAKILSQHVDLTLYVVRQNFTLRNELEGIIKTNALPKLHLIFNDVKPLPGYAYGYGSK
jgi:tyrosine-protein kinase Etk/Wzc